ncbi:MAG: NAD-dependent epimerase/dehydratase family protein [Elusimicrobiota bacterium]
MPSPKSILVLGHGGFIGGRLGARLRRDYPKSRLYGCDVRVRRAAHMTEAYRCDLRDTKRLAAILRRTRPDWVFHLAGAPSGKDLAGMLDSHVLATLSLLEAAAAGKRSPRIILPGSAAEYGILKPAQMPVRESAPAHPATAYGLAKLLQTELAQTYMRRGLDVVVARMFNVLGAGLDRRLALSSFVDQVVRIERGRRPPVLQVGDLTAKRDFVDIDEAVAALIRIARRGRAGHAYNVCSGKSYPMQALVDELLRLARRPIRLRRTRARLRPVDLPDMRGSTRKTARETGWRARRTPFACLREMLEERRREK